MQQSGQARRKYTGTKPHSMWPGPLIGPLGNGSNGNRRPPRPGPGWAPFDLWLAAVKAADAPRPTDDDVSRHKRADEARERRLFWSAAMRKEIIGMAAAPERREGGGHHYEGIVRCCEDFRLTHD